MSIYYKVVRANLFSARTDSYEISRRMVKYKIGKWISAPNNTRLFLFENLEDAQNFANQGERIFECKAIGVIRGFPAHFSFSYYWNLIESLLKKKKKVNFDSKEFRGYTITNRPSILAKKVKLVKEVKK